MNKYYYYDKMHCLSTAPIKECEVIKSMYPDYLQYSLKLQLSEVSSCTIRRLYCIHNLYIKKLL